MAQDERLQTLARRFKETESLEDEVAWLSLRVRTETISQRRAEFAAFLGHPAAIQLVGVQVPPGSPSLNTSPREYLQAWGSTLAHMGWRAAARALLAIARFHHEREQSRESRELALPALSLATYRIDRLQEAILALDVPAWDLANHWQHAVLPDIYGPSAKVLVTALDAAHETLERRSALSLENWWQRIYGSFPPFGDLNNEELASALDEFRQGKSPAALPELCAVSEELAPLVLGYFDPIEVRRAKSLREPRSAHACSESVSTTDPPRIRGCSACFLHVVDLEGLDPGAAQGLLESTLRRPCLSVYRRQDGLFQAEDCPSLRDRARANAPAFSAYSPPADLDGHQDWDETFP